jgi:hypothetical protein
VNLRITDEPWYIADASEAAENIPGSRVHIPTQDAAATLETGDIVMFWIRKHTDLEDLWWGVPATVISRYLGELLIVEPRFPIEDLGIDNDARFVLEPGHIAGMRVSESAWECMA